MKFLPIVVLIIVQQLAMIFFMRVVRWQLFESAGAAALVAIAAGLLVGFAQRRAASRKGGEIGDGR
jgi:uncharacterized protein YqfA (UPF0365 family)